MKVKCPTCGQSAEYSADNIYRPFCSERCQLLDLGQWAEEKYRLPASQQESVNDSVDAHDEETHPH